MIESTSLSHHRLRGLTVDVHYFFIDFFFCVIKPSETWQLKNTIMGYGSEFRQISAEWFFCSMVLKALTG
jgi:hypothetical protein